MLDTVFEISLACLICLARIVDVSLGTLRIIFVSRGYRILAPILGFFEILIRNDDGDGIVSGVERVRAREAGLCDFGIAETFCDECEVVDGVGRIGVGGDGLVENAAGFFEATELEQNLAFEGAVNGLVGAGLARAADEEDRALQVVEVEERLRLQVVDLGLKAAICPGKLRLAREEFVALL